MSECKVHMLQLSKEFKECQRAFIAIGDETRQQIIIALLESDCQGIRVGEITKKTHLSRPAVSHHLQILKDANIISMRREGTMNYYFMSASETQWGKILLFMQHVNEVINDMSDEDKKTYSRTETD
ncbi:MAG: winged helix-turn-helix transcriptional regulator [Clostridiaceae bacterium]|nr:winged helix-turn-helix transcriptional regulator [Clostridiaceae bacterium]